MEVELLKALKTHLYRMSFNCITIDLTKSGNC